MANLYPGSPLSGSDKKVAAKRHATPDLACLRFLG